MVYYADQEHPRKRLKLWNKSEATWVSGSMEDFNSETDSDYTSYWRDWVGLKSSCLFFHDLTAVLHAMRCLWFKSNEFIRRLGSYWAVLYTTGVDDKRDCEILGAKLRKTRDFLG